MGNLGERRFPWEGMSLCSGLSRATNQPCGKWEIEGMGYCLHHVPADMLDEAEEVTGMRLCRHGPADEGGICRYLAVEGTKPPMCKVHGANQGSYQRNLAEERVIEGEVIEHLERILTTGGEQLLNPPAIKDPLTELLMLAGEVKVFKQMLTEKVSVMHITDWRYDSKALGEQTRAEIIIYERALDRFANILIQISKLGIEDRLAQVDERMLQTLERAMVMALESTGLDLVGIDKARRVLRRELHAIEGHAMTGEDQ